MTEKTYNGWTNYETWNVNLWIGNEEGSCRYWDEQAEEAFEDAEADSIFRRSERAKLNLADRLKDEFENASQDLLEGAKAQCSMWADLLNGALSEVNWHEIADHMLDNVDGYGKDDAKESEAA